MHNAKHSAVLRRWAAGYRLDQICSEVRVSPEEASRVLREAGVNGRALARRNRRAKEVAREVNQDALDYTRSSG